MANSTIEDIIPYGTFNSELTEEQVRALELIRKIGEILVHNNPEIAELYRKGEEFATYLQIAKAYVPDAEEFPGVASRAVGFAIRKLIPREELDRITKQRSAENLEEIFGGFNTECFKAHCVKAARKRHELDIGVDVAAMIRGRGRTPWSEEEKQCALGLSQSSEYQHTEGSIAGTPNYALIAAKLNSLYHDCSRVRYANSVASFIRDTRRNHNK
jgi:hypothetical protein